MDYYPDAMPSFRQPSRFSAGANQARRLSFDDLLFTSVPRTRPLAYVLYILYTYTPRLINDRLSFFLSFVPGVKHYSILAMNDPYDPINPALYAAFLDYLDRLGSCKKSIDHFPCTDTAFPGQVLSAYPGERPSLTDGPPTKVPKTGRKGKGRETRLGSPVNGIPFDEVGCNIRVGWDRTEYRERSEPYGDRFYDILSGNFRSSKQDCHVDLRCDKCITAGTEVWFRRVAGLNRFAVSLALIERLSCSGDFGTLRFGSSRYKRE